MKTLWILAPTLLAMLLVSEATSGTGRSDVQSLSDGATYPVGTVVGGPCQHNGALPEDTRDVESIDEVFEATKLVTPRGSEVFLSPPGCEPVTLAEPGEYTAIVNQVTTHWKKTRTIRLKQTSGEVKETAYFSKTSDGDIKTYRFTVDKREPEASTDSSCAKRQDPHWVNQFDGCSVYLQTSLSEDPLEMPVDRNNPAGGGDTQFANPTGMLPIHGRCRDGDDCGPCDKHDICYQTCGSSQAVCDLEMFQDMVAVCRSSSEDDSVKETCLGWAAAYWKGLSELGEGAFMERQEQVCVCQ